MTAIMQTRFSDTFSWIKSFVFWLKFHWSLFLKGPMESKPSLVEIMTWCRIGDKPLFEPMLTMFTDAYLWHWWGWVKASPWSGMLSHWPRQNAISLSHPVLGWLYVFSLFPPRPPRPRPSPQKLFPLTSKPFELNLWYLVQRIYGSGEMYWMTFPWTWPKVTAVASISKNLLVCAIKWEPLIGSLQIVAALLP